MELSAEPHISAPMELSDAMRCDAMPHADDVRQHQSTCQTFQKPSGPGPREHGVTDTRRRKAPYPAKGGKTMPRDGESVAMRGGGEARTTLYKQ